MAAPTLRMTAVRGPALTFSDDPFRDGLEARMVHEPDAIVARADGRIVQFGGRPHRAKLRQMSELRPIAP